MWAQTNKHTPHVHVSSTGTVWVVGSQLPFVLLLLLFFSLLPLLVLLLIATEFDFVLFLFYSATILFYLRLVCVSVPGIGQVLPHWTNIPRLILMLWDWGLLSSPDWPWIWSSWMTGTPGITGIYYQCLAPSPSLKEILQNHTFLAYKIQLSYLLISLHNLTLF